MDRRDFIALGGAATFLGAGGSSAQAAIPKAGLYGRSVTDFGAEPDSDSDQTAALQRAIDEIAGTGQPVYVPPGRYFLSTLTIPANATIIGVPGHSVLARRGSDTPLIYAPAAKSIRLSGLTLDGAATAPAKGPTLILLNGGNAILNGLTLVNAAADGLSLTGVTPEISGCRFERCFGVAIKLRQANTGTITGNNIDIVGIGIDYDARPVSGVAIISGNRVRKAAQQGIVVSGNATLSGNVIEDAGEFGLRLGGPTTLGTFSAVNNMIRNANVGIGVSNADGGYGVITLNMIAGAKGGGIRALNDGVITGPDLAKSSPEAFRNLVIGGNVTV